MVFVPVRNQPLQIIDDFSKFSGPLRSTFDDYFSEPLSLDSKRFVWDYWHVPGQYNLLRTPAYHYFPQKLYLQFHKQLVMWGRRNLGCWDISPPWLSCYVEGCEQKLHADVPHGPWAFVLSLSPRSPKFTGGETVLLRESVLQYWKSQNQLSGFETSDLVQSIKPKFNRLIVFDGRVPHGVSRVDGVQDPREGRLVIHGWFSQPKTYIEGLLPKASAERKLNQAVEQVQQLVSNGDEMWGTLAIELAVAKNGLVQKAKYLTLNVRNQNGDIPRDKLKAILRIYSSLEFPRTRGISKVVVPLIFQN